MNFIPSRLRDACEPGDAESPTPDTETEHAGAEAVHERLNHLFRGSLQRGLIHPLYLPMMKYRHGQAES